MLNDDCYVVTTSFIYGIFMLSSSKICSYTYKYRILLLLSCLILGPYSQRFLFLELVLFLDFFL